MTSWESPPSLVKTESAGVVEATPGGTVVTSSSSANTKGSWTEILASTSFDASGFLLILESYGLTDTFTFLVDISVGAAGSEVAIIENLAFSSRRGLGDSMFVPLQIPAGSRVAVRCQSTSTSKSVEVVLNLISRSFTTHPGFQRATTYGAVTGDSGGTELDPGGTAHTKGSWVEITSSSTSPIREFLIFFGTRANVAVTQGDCLVDIGIGSAGSETTILENILLRLGGEIDGPSLVSFGPIPVTIPPGTRIAARCQSTVIDATDRLLDISLIGFD